MKIYRGPSSKEFSDDLHELVDTKDLGGIAPWVGSFCFPVNITKDPSERQAVAHLDIQEADVLNLYQAMIKGWEQRVQTHDLLDREVRALREALSQIRISASVGKSTSDSEMFTEIMAIANSTTSKNEA